MKILAIDSSGMTASAAIAEDGKLVAEYSVNYKKTHSQTLLPMIEELRRMAQLDLNSIDAVAVAAGPGSFTGLRIGSATAKGIGLALNKPLIAVPTLEGMAWNLWGTKDVICPLMDARRSQVYTGVYCFDGEDQLQILCDQMAVPVEEIIGRLNELGRPVILLGDGADVCQGALRAGLAVPFRFAPPHQNAQRAAALAICAREYARKGALQTAAEHRPEYLRLSQAERERREKQAAAQEKAPSER